MTKPLHLGQAPITLDDLIDVTRHGRAVLLADAARAAMKVSEDWVAGLSAQMDRGEPTQAIYSINTGFGSLSGRQAFKTSAQARDLSRRLVVSNAAGVGRHLDHEVVRAAMLIRAASLTRGYSAARGEVVETILAMLERGVIPAVPEYGSLGASGDLIPLAHMTLDVARGGEPRSTAATGSGIYAASLDEDGDRGFVSGRRRGRCLGLVSHAQTRWPGRPQPGTAQVAAAFHEAPMGWQPYRNATAGAAAYRMAQFPASGAAGDRPIGANDAVRRAFEAGGQCGRCH